MSPDRPFAAQGDWLQVLEMCTEIEVEIGAHGFLTANAQVLVPESFLEEFHGAVSSLEGNFSVLSIENSS